MADLTDFVAALRSHVVGGGASSVTAVIGDRFTPMPIPQGQPKPCATYSIYNTRPENVVGEGGEDGMLAVEFQIDAWGETFDAALLVAERIRVRLQTASFTPLPEPSESNGVHLYEDDTRLHRFHWRYTCQFPTS